MWKVKWDIFTCLKCLLNAQYNEQEEVEDDDDEEQEKFN